MQTQLKQQPIDEVNQQFQQATAFDQNNLTGMLNDLLRQQLTPNLPAEQSQNNINVEEVIDDLSSCAVAAVEELLFNSQFQRDKVHSKLSQLFHQQKEIYLNTPIKEELRKRQYISHCGLVMSPDNCITTQLDDIRVRSFIRSIDHAIKAKLAQQPSLHIVYPACGPFAPLLMPLLAYYKNKATYSAEQIKVTLIDIQLGAVKTLEALITEMAIEEYIEDVVCLDATQYTPKNKSIDIVVLEAMQHGLSREGQLPLALHFAKLLNKKGVFIPEKVEVNGYLCIAQQEFVEQWREAKSLSAKDMDTEIFNQRLSVGNILTFTADTLRNMPELLLGENTRLLTCNTVTIPEIKSNQEYTLILTTKISTGYSSDHKEIIDEYDSGITHPLPDQSVCINFTPREVQAGDLLVNSGDAIKFYYRLNGLPGFLATLSN